MHQQLNPMDLATLSAQLTTNRNGLKYLDWDTIEYYYSFL
jgi:hypothetical protein